MIRKLGVAIVLPLFALLVGPLLISPSDCSSAGGTPRGGTGFVLTTKSVLRVDLEVGRIVLGHALSLPGRKIVRADHHVFVQQADAIQIFDAETVTAQHSVRVPEGITDIAASGSLLYAASGRRIHVFCILPDGGADPLRSIVLPKRIDLLATSGRLLYALDDVVEPLYAHCIDVTRPGPPRIATATWEGFNASLVAQVVADRWYVMVADAEYGLYIVTLPVRPPLGKVTQRNMLSIYNGGGPAARIRAEALYHEFQVYDGMLYGLDGLNSIRVFQRPVNSNQDMATEVADLGSVTLEHRRGIIEVAGSTLYVAGETTLYTFRLRKGAPPAAALRINAGAPIVSLTVGPHPP